MKRNWRKSYEFSCWLGGYNRLNNANVRPSNVPDDVLAAFHVDRKAGRPYPGYTPDYRKDKTI